MSKHKPVMTVQQQYSVTGQVALFLPLSSTPSTQDMQSLPTICLVCLHQPPRHFSEQLFMSPKAGCQLHTQGVNCPVPGKDSQHHTNLLHGDRDGPEFLRSALSTKQNLLELVSSPGKICLCELLGISWPKEAGGKAVLYLTIDMLQIYRYIQICVAVSILI